MTSSASFVFGATFLQFLVLTAIVAQGCTYLEGVRIPGGDWGSPAPADSREECCLRCRHVEGCQAVTFYVSGPNAKTCFMKKDIGTPEPDASATTAVATGTCTFESGYEYNPRFTISTFPDIANKESCCYWCTATTKCVGFSFFPAGPKAGNCDLKFALTDRIADPNVISATYSASSKTCSYEPSFAHLGGVDLKSTAGVASKEACCAQCRSAPKCAAIEYARSGPRAATCVLKATASADKLINTAAVSGQVSGGAPCGSTR